MVILICSYKFLYQILFPSAHPPKAEAHDICVANKSQPIVGNLYRQNSAERFGKASRHQIVKQAFRQNAIAMELVTFKDNYTEIPTLANANLYPNISRRVYTLCQQVVQQRIFVSVAFCLVSEHVPLGGHTSLASHASLSTLPLSGDTL